jgi:uncharacterized protein (TIGR00251 family)
VAASSRGSGPFRRVERGLEVAVRLQPGARRAGLEGFAELTDGRVVLKARVGEPPEGGKANAALIKMLAKALKAPKGAISIVAGRRQRLKTVLIEGDPPALEARLDHWLAGD